MRNPEFAARQDTSYLTCRNVRHAWDISKFRNVTGEEAAAFSLRKWKQAIVRELRCFRCDTVKLEFFARDNPNVGFSRVKGNYVYPKGYLFAGKLKDGDRPDRWDYFEALLDRRTTLS